MSLKFIFGPSGSGKSFYLYHHVIEESMKHPEENYLVLVPEQFTMQTQKDFVQMHPNHGIMNIDILSFGRLAYRIFEETGGGQLSVLDDEGKNLILRKIAGDHEKELVVLRGNIKKTGYISEVKSVISEFDQYDIGTDELDLMMKQAGEESRLYYKLKDIKLLYEQFHQYLEDKYITKEELLDVLCREVEKSEILKNSTVVMDGFTGFTPVQNRLIGKLLKSCRRVIITVTIDPAENPYTYRHPYQLFGLSKQMVTSLIEVAKEARVQVEDPVKLYGEPVRRFETNSEMAFLEKHLFRYRAKEHVYEEDMSQIALHAARNPKAEAMAAAGRIRELVRSQGLRYREIGVIVSNMESYGDYLEQAFEEYEIPSFMDHKRSILLNPYIEYIRSLLGMAKQGFSYESVFRFLRTHLSGFTYDEVDALENYVIGLGLKGYKKWQMRWVRKLRDTTEDDLEMLNHLRVLLVEKVDPLMMVLRQRSKTVRDITEALYAFLVQEDLQQKLSQQEDMFQKQGELSLAKEYAQIYRILIELFDKFVSLLGDEKVSLQEYMDLLDAGLEEARVGVIPQGVDQVVAGDILRTRLKDIKALIFLGANDALLPGSLMKNGLLTERDRDRFEKAKVRLSPGSKEQTFVQKFYLYLNLTKPSDYLDIYYSKVSADGKSVRPAYLIQDVIRLFPKIKVQDEERRALSEQEITKKQGIRYLIEGLRTAKETSKVSDSWKEIFIWYKNDPQFQEKVDLLLDAGFYQRKMDGLTRQIAEVLYGDFPSSISRMERFMACSFAHFLTYGLRLKERETYEFEALDLGNICHKGLERYDKKVRERGKQWTDLTEEEQAAFVDESIDESIVDYENTVLYSSARNEYLIVRMKQMMRRTVWALTKQIEAGDFNPTGAEVPFANGKIDRVDICDAPADQKLYVKVIDYKTGSKEFDAALLYYGLQLQLMVYLQAAVDRQHKLHPDRKVTPAGVFYYRIKDPIIPKTEADASEAMLRELRPDGIVNGEEEILRRMDRQNSGESLVIPVKYNKDGTLSKASRVADEEGFYAMMSHAAVKTKEAKSKIKAGMTDAFPYRTGTETGCDYCAYRHICGFDQKLGYRYHDLEKLSREDAIAKMKEENPWQKGE